MRWETHKTEGTCVPVSSFGCGLNPSTSLGCGGGLDLCAVIALTFGGGLRWHLAPRDKYRSL